MTFVAKHRLIEDVSLEQEWIYLINETLAGERCILPLLENLNQDQRLPNALRGVLQRQIEEESDHVARYEAAFDHRKIRGTGYEKQFTDFVSSIDSPTLEKPSPILSSRTSTHDAYWNMQNIRIISGMITTLLGGLSGRYSGKPHGQPAHRSS